MDFPTKENKEEVGGWLSGIVSYIVSAVVSSLSGDLFFCISIDLVCEELNNKGSLNV